MVALFVVAFPCIVAAQEVKRAEVKRSDLTGTNMEVIMSVVEVPPGATLPKHFHYGEEVFYVLEGDDRVPWSSAHYARPGNRESTPEKLRMRATRLSAKRH